MSKHGRYERQMPRKRMSGSKIALIIVAILLVLIIAAVIIGVFFYNSFLNSIPRAEHTPNSVSQEEIDAIMNYNPDAPVDVTMAAAETEVMETTAPATIPTTEPPHVPSAEDVLNVLVVGQAARAGEEHRMADTMILVSINKHTKVMTLTSFLRDTYLKLPDYKDLAGRQHTCGKQKLTVCYHLGYTFGGTADAMLMMNQCLKENFGIDVDFNVEVDFMGVELITNYLGGVEIDLTEAEAAYLNADDNYVLYDVSPGPQMLDGMALLSYARMRKDEGNGESDINRTRRQRLVLEKLFEKIRGNDVAGLQRLLTDFMGLVTTNMTNEDITECILEIFPILPELTIETGTCPVETTYWGEIIELGGYPASVLHFDMGQNKRLMRAITEGVVQ